jgi:hypothetical protein
MSGAAKMIVKTTPTTEGADKIIVYSGQEIIKYSTSPTNLSHMVFLPEKIEY